LCCCCVCVVLLWAVGVVVLCGVVGGLVGVGGGGGERGGVDRGGQEGNAYRRPCDRWGHACTNAQLTSLKGRVENSIYVPAVVPLVLVNDVASENDCSSPTEDRLYFKVKQ